MITDSATTNTFQGDVVRSTARKIDKAFAGKLIQSLHTDVYTDKPLAVVREYYSNAIDSHKKAGTPINKIKITAPTFIDCRFVLRDYGVGMTSSEVDRYYGSFGDSTKSFSIEDIGGFGIGSKAGNSYSDSFTVRAFKGGKETMAICTSAKSDNDPFGTGSTNIIYEIDTNEPDGVEISLTVKSADIDAFKEAITKMLVNKTQEELPVLENMTFESKVFRVIDLGTIEVCNKEIKVQARYMKINPSEHNWVRYDSLFLSLSSVPYFKECIPDGFNGSVREFLNQNVYVTLEIVTDLVKPALSREYIQMSTELIHLYTKLRNSLLAFVTEENKEQTSITEWKKLAEAHDKMDKLGYRPIYSKDYYGVDGHQISSNTLRSINPKKTLVISTITSSYNIKNEAYETTQFIRPTKYLNVAPSIVNFPKGSQCTIRVFKESIGLQLPTGEVDSITRNHFEQYTKEKETTHLVDAITFYGVINKILGVNPPLTFRQWKKNNESLLVPIKPTAKTPVHPISYNGRKCPTEADLNARLDAHKIYKIMCYTPTDAQRFGYRDDSDSYARVHKGTPIPSRCHTVVDDFVQDVIKNSGYNLKKYLVEEYFHLDLNFKNILNYKQSNTLSGYLEKFANGVFTKEEIEMIREYKSVVVTLKQYNENAFSTNRISIPSTLSSEKRKLILDTLNETFDAHRNELKLRRDELLEKILKIVI